MNANVAGADVEGTTVETGTFTFDSVISCSAQLAAPRVASQVERI